MIFNYDIIFYVSDFLDIKTRFCYSLLNKRIHGKLWNNDYKKDLILSMNDMKLKDLLYMIKEKRIYLLRYIVNSEILVDNRREFPFLFHFLLLFSCINNWKKGYIIVFNNLKLIINEFKTIFSKEHAIYVYVIMKNLLIIGSDTTLKYNTLLCDLMNKNNIYVDDLKELFSSIIDIHYDKDTIPLYNYHILIENETNKEIEISIYFYYIQNLIYNGCGNNNFTKELELLILVLNYKFCKETTYGLPYNYTFEVLAERYDLEFILKDMFYSNDIQ